MSNKNVLSSIEFSRGDIIFEEHQEGKCAFLIKKGVVVIYRIIGEEKVVLGTLKSGDIIGEMAVITGEPRTAYAIAAEDSELFVINEDTLHNALDGTLPFIKALVKQLIDRFRNMNKTHDELSDNSKKIKSLENALDVLIFTSTEFTKSNPDTSEEVRSLLKTIEQTCADELKKRT